MPYTGPVGADGNPTFDAYHDVPAGGCTGQSPASWRIPIALQILPAILLGIGMFWMPYSPRWLTEVGRDEEAKNTLAYLRSSTVEDPSVVHEFLEIKAEVLIERELRHAKTAGKGGIRGMIQPYLDLVSTRSNFHRLWIGCSTMFFQQFIGCVRRLSTSVSLSSSTLTFRVVRLDHLRHIASPTSPSPRLPLLRLLVIRLALQRIYGIQNAIICTSARQPYLRRPC